MKTRGESGVRADDPRVTPGNRGLSDWFGRLIALAAIFGATGVVFGAFGAHALAGVLEGSAGDTWDTAARYHLLHAVALIGVAYIHDRRPRALSRAAGVFFIVGIVLFSGSLYVLAVTDIKILGAVAPLGGAALIAGWMLLAAAVLGRTHTAD